MVSDAELVQKILEGEQQVYEELVRRYAIGLCGYIRQQIKNVSDAEDISQETFLKAYCHLTELRNPSQFGSWLFRIARNTCMDWNRKRPQSFQSLSNDIPQPESSISSVQNPWDCLNRLPEKYRIPLFLKHHQKFSCQEIAQNLNLSLPAVTKRLSRAYQMIRNELKNQEEL
ncbi:MAG: RNA polymerase sigma factor [Planctomycetota bacterium]